MLSRRQVIANISSRFTQKNQCVFCTHCCIAMEIQPPKEMIKNTKKGSETRFECNIISMVIIILFCRFFSCTLTFWCHRGHRETTQMNKLLAPTCLLWFWSFHGEYNHYNSARLKDSEEKCVSRFWYYYGCVWPNILRINFFYSRWRKHYNVLQE